MKLIGRKKLDFEIGGVTNRDPKADERMIPK
jgi:hypothetical protein